MWKRVSHYTFATAALCINFFGCSKMEQDTIRADNESESRSTAEVSPKLIDGVYPVIQPGKRVPRRFRNAKSIELTVNPVGGFESGGVSRIRIALQPLVFFEKGRSFGFRFEENKCTEIEFKNTDALREYTRNSIGHRLAVVVDGRVITHHKIREAINSKKVRITCCTEGGGDHLYKYLKSFNDDGGAKTATQQSTK